ncbi:unnamed protein product [Anisakis simplex]|uniref:Lactamase_B domain-containing protein n=1 Tax=Anisakis simplex TaxID=6269 RepID=A0A0M3KD87_ANISI|nr:unnamed protein product [Anisakis simplex]
MVASVHQILIGYSNESSSASQDALSASGSVTLIINGNRKILVDCGDPWNGEQLLTELKAYSVSNEDVTDLIITHGHSDHCGNLSLFRKATIYMDHDCARAQSQYTSLEDEFEVTENVYVIRTVGHTDHDLSVVVTGTQRGWDIFENGLTDQWQANSRYVEKQQQSRERIISMADWIVPGHGEIFKNQLKKN